MAEQQHNLGAEPRLRPLGSTMWIVGLILLLLVAQFALFQRYLGREVVWTYPAHHDQATYLRRAYETYERIRSEGFFRGVAAGPDVPNGAVLHVQAALLFLLTGPSRAAALSLNFLYLAVLELVMVWALYRITRGWTAGFIALGLLLAARTSFAEAGGIADFRLDFITLCLFGDFVCLVLRSRVFEEPRWSIAAGGVAALLVCFRFVAAAYVGAVVGATLAALLLAWAMARESGPRHRRKRQLIGALAATATIALAALPVLWLHRQSLHDYYVVGHVTGHERDIRIAQFHTADWREAALFYPRSLLRDHIGTRLVMIMAVLLCLAALDRFSRRKTVAAAGKPNAIDDYAFVIAAAVLPLAVLTLDAHKSPVVADVAVVPLVMLVAMVATDLIRHRIILRGAAALVLTLGFVFFARSLARPTPLSRHRDDMHNLDRLYDLIAARADTRRNGGIVLLSTDCTADYLYYNAIEVMIYERHHVMLDLRELIGGIFEKPEDQVFASLQQADFVFLTTRPGRTPKFEYPFDREMERLHPRLEAFCRRHLTEIGHARVIDRDVTLFAARP